jgi:hypothetical protein
MVNTCHLAKQNNFNKILYLFGLAQAADRTYYTKGIALFGTILLGFVDRTKMAGKQVGLRNETQQKISGCSTQLQINRARC